MAQLIPIPQDGGDGAEDDDADALAGLKADIKAAKGSAMLVETTAGGYDQGAVNAPRSDWKAMRLGPQPPEAFVKVAGDSVFPLSRRVLASRPGLFAEGADGTAMRESLRQFHMGVIRPLAVLLETELTEKFGAAVSLKFDDYGRDMVSRSQVFAKLAAVEGVSPELAMELSGMVANG